MSDVIAAPAPPPKKEAEHPCLEIDAPPFAGKYRAERVLGQGGMGVVFEARHIRTGHRVAIKVLSTALRDHPELVERFEREARAAGSLTSSHSVRVFDIDTTEDGTPFIVMELLAGRDLSSIVERDGRQPVSRAVRWIIEACEAIAEAHLRGIIHRDIKPSNLFLTDVEERKVVKVLDFGIAKRVSTEESAITEAVAPLGTPQYMSPEQVRCAKDVDSRSDIWSLGVTLYEIVCGTTPFSHESSYACIASIAADPVPDPRTFRADLSDGFVAVLMRALAKDANDRYATVDELVTALAPFALDDVFDDEEMVSAVRRACERSAAPKTPRDQATLDAVTPEPGVVADSAPAVVAAPPPDIDGMRLPFESRSDRTIPPAVSHANVVTPRNKRSSMGRSMLVMASAAALGVAALVYTPRWLDGDAPPAVSHSVATTTMAFAIPSAAAAAEQVVAPVASASETASASASAQAVSAQAVEAAPRVVAPATQAVHVVHAKVEKKEAPAPVQVTRNSAGVHGGLSNPGF